MITLLPLLFGVAPLAEDAPPHPFQCLFWADVDGDGLDDAVAIDEHGAVRLLRNDGDGRFEDVSERVGLSEVRGVHQVACADADGDGLLDLYLAAWGGESRLLAQTDAGTLVDRTDEAGLPRYAEPLEARWRDVDGDGHVDLWLTTLHDDLVYRNDGRGAFVALDLGIAPRVGLPRALRPATVEAARAQRGLAAPDAAGAAGAGVTSGTAGAGIGFEVVCALGVQDDANPADCLRASSVPTLGLLYPISSDWYVQAGTGRVGLGTTSPAHRLDVDGDVRATRLRASATTGTSPLVVTSTTRVDNLNADRLDGFDASAFAQLPITSGDLADGAVTSTKIAPSAVSGTNILNGTIFDADVNGAAGISGTKIFPSFGSQDVRTNTQFLAEGFGSYTNPAYQFVDGEATGLSSPSLNLLALLSDGQAVLTVHPDGRVVAGTAGGYGNAVFSTISTGTQIPIVAGNSSGLPGTTGIYGIASDGTASAGTGVLGVGGEIGVEGICDRPSGYGVRGNGLDAGFITDGVLGYVQGASSYGVWGINNDGGYGLFATGDSGATGVKTFLQPHPDDAARVLRFVCLEGNEAGTYFRGSAETVAGFAQIDVPEVFRMVSEADDLTVQVTPRGPATLWVESVDLNRIVVRGTADVPFDYFVNGVRLGYRDLELVQENRAYRPLERGVPYGAELPPAIRQLLVRNGTLNADFTPNESTAARLGWVLAEPGSFSPPVEPPELAAPTMPRDSAPR